MVYQYKNNGYNIVLDVNSGSIHLVDEVAYDVIEMYDKKERSEITESICAKYKADGVDEKELEELYQDIEQLIAEGTLFTEDTYKEGVIDFKKRSTVAVSYTHLTLPTIEP